MKLISTLLLAALLAGCATQPDTRTEAQKYPCGRPSMMGADITCPQGENVSILLLPSRTNADLRGAD